jgi:hypothetical protein
MIDFDDLRGKAEEFLEDHADQVDQGIDKAAGVAGTKYGHGSQIDQGAEKLKDLLPGGDDDDPATRRPGAGAQHRQAGRHGAGRAQQGGQHRAGRQGGRPKPGA